MMSAFPSLVLIITICSLGACAPAGSAAQDGNAGGMTQAQAGAAKSWFDWHDAKREVETARDEALKLNEPGGADYPKALAIVRASGWPQSVIDLDIGSMIIASYEDKQAARRPVETLQQGIATMEQAALGSGEGADVAPQRLRILFERGAGTAPDWVIAPDPSIAACWRALENGGEGDPRRCVALRRERMRG